LSANTLISIAKSKSTANRLAKTLSAAELKKAIDHLQAALTDIKKREAAKAAKKQAADLKKLKAMMAKLGITAADVRKLTATGPKRKAASKKLLPNAKPARAKAKRLRPNTNSKSAKKPINGQAAVACRWCSKSSWIKTVHWISA
jgi:hypothetical protein